MKGCMLRTGLAGGGPRQVPQLPPALQRRKSQGQLWVVRVRVAVCPSAPDWPLVHSVTLPLPRHSCRREAAAPLS